MIGGLAGGGKGLLIRKRAYVPAGTAGEGEDQLEGESPQRIVDGDSFNARGEFGSHSSDPGSPRLRFLTTPVSESTEGVLEDGRARP